MSDAKMWDLFRRSAVLNRQIAAAFDESSAESLAMPGVTVEAVGHIAGVYFLRAGAAGPIKIGFARSIAQRMRSLATASPEELRFVGHVAGANAVERQLHDRFKQFRLRGEWFAPAPELLDFIEKEATKP